MPLPETLVAGLREDARTLLPAAALLLVRKYSDSDTCQVGVQRRTGEGPITVAMPPDSTLAEHLREVGAQIDQLPERPQPQAELASVTLVCTVDAGIAAPQDVPVTLSVTLTTAGGTLHIDHHEHALDPDLTARMPGHVITILDQLVHHTGTAANQLRVMTEEEEAELRRFNETRTAYPRNATVYQLFAEQVAAGPGRIAASHLDSSLTYQQLAEKVDGLARDLYARGVRQHSRVAYLLGKSPRLLVAALAIVRLGATYVPIDPKSPPNRVNFVIADSDAELLLTAGPGPAVNVPVVDLDRLPDPVNGPPLPEPAGAAEDDVCVLYTSGTTGAPKGVVIGNRAIVRLVRNSNYRDFSNGVTILQTGAVGFDATTFEFWAAMLNGGELVFVPESTLIDPEQLRAVIRKHRVDTLILTTALFHQTIDYDPRVLEGCCVLVGGEIASARHFAAAAAACPGSTFVNVYGPTENTVFTTTYPATAAESDKVPIGRPVANSTVWVLDRDRNLQPIGVTGEIYLGGDGLSNGYLNRPELNAAAFITGSPATHERLYRTGDFARWRSDGTLDFVGRADGQVKIRGFRIELAEVENRLARLDGVQECVVLKRERPGGEVVLCAYLTAKHSLDSAALRAALREDLPDYMVPAVIQQIDEMPMNRNHKTDRVALAALELADPQAPSAPGRAPRTPLETAVAELFTEVLERPSISIDDDFFALGGHSLRVMRLWSRIRIVLATDIELSQILDEPTVAGIAAKLSSPQPAPIARPRLVRRP